MCYLITGSPSPSIARATKVLHLTGVPPEVAPLRAPRLSLLPQFQGEHRERTLWGTYRPGLYFGAPPLLKRIQLRTQPVLGPSEHTALSGMQPH